MNFPKFADLMEDIGFRGNEPIAPIFRLSRKDLKNRVFRESYFKMAGHYQVVSVWSQEGEVALWAKRGENNTNIFPFHKKEVDFLAKKKKFKKSVAPKMVLHHDDPPCTAQLTTRKGGRWCPKCKLHPDMQSTCFYFYCPSCNVPLKNLRCPKCTLVFQRPT